MRAVNQVYTHGGGAVDDPVAFLDCPNAVCSYGGWYFLGKNQDQSVETVFEPDSFEYVLLSYSSSGLARTQSSILYGRMSREADAEFVYYVRSRYYQTDKGFF